MDDGVWVNCWKVGRTDRRWAQVRWDNPGIFFWVKKILR